MIPVRLPALATTLLLFTVPLAAAAADAPLAKEAAKQAGKARASPGAEPPAAATAAGPASDDPMERLRQRLAERLAGPGGGAAAGTLELQVGTRAPARGTGHNTTAAAPSAHAGQAGREGPGHVGVARAAVHGDSAASARKAADADHGGATAPGTASVMPTMPTHRVSASLHAPVAVPAPQVRRAAAAHGAAGGHAAAHWSYEGAGEPAAWGSLRPDFNLCANGQRQSPIDIRGGLAVELDPVKFDYRPSPFSVIDNGHTVQVNLPPGNSIEAGGRRYELVQFHFHRPSEERIDGRQFEMSLHLVHKSAEGKLAVVGVLLGKGPAHPVVQAVWNNLPLEKNEEARATASLDPAHLLPADPRYYTYMGSLTTPPCSEGVLWLVMRTPVTVTEEQLQLFARIYPMNARPAQPVAGRRIMQSQ